MDETVIIIAKYLIVILVLALTYVFFKQDKRHKVEMVALLAASVIVAALLAKLASVLHQDPRPFARDGITPYFSHGPDNGFPSDHTTYSAVIAFVIMKYSHKLGIALAVLALLIGSARVVAGVHHGQDIIAGFLIAAASTGLSVLVLKFVQSRHSS